MTHDTNHPDKAENADNAEKADKAGKADKADDKSREKPSEPRVRKLTTLGVEGFNNADSLIILLTIGQRNKKKSLKEINAIQRQRLFVMKFVGGTRFPIYRFDHYTVLGSASFIY